jgi:hypothetical protein
MCRLRFIWYFPTFIIDCQTIFTNWLGFICQKEEEEDYAIKFLGFILIEVKNYFVKIIGFFIYYIHFFV